MWHRSKYANSLLPMKAALQQWKNMISDVIVNVFHVCTLRNVVSMAGFETSCTKPVIYLQVAKEIMICEWNYKSGIRPLTNILSRFCSVKSCPVIFFPAFHNFKVAAKREGKVVTAGVLVCATFIHTVGRCSPSGQDKMWWQTHISFTLTPLLLAEDMCRRPALPQGPCVLRATSECLLYKAHVFRCCKVESRLASFLWLNK